MIETTLHSDVLEIVIANPPVNALNAGLRRALIDAIEMAEGDARVGAVVMRGAGRMFSAGADITELDRPQSGPTVADLVERIEACGKPVVAAIHGAALGGGLELALASHYRISSAEAKLGLPEVKLGLLPGAGGTQRLPRLIGLRPALEMIVLGEPVSGARGFELGLVDRLADASSLSDEALAYARAQKRPRRTGDRNIVGDEASIDRFAMENDRAIRGFESPLACIESINASRLPLAEGLARERAIFGRLAASEQAAALRHLFFAERAAAKVDGIPAGLRPRPVERVGIVGAGTMGVGISMAFLSAGMPVTLTDATEAALTHGVSVINGNYDAAVAKGRVTAEQGAAATSLLTPALGYDGLEDCDLIIEAVYEDLELKRSIFERLDRVAKPSAILASNTSMLDINALAASTSRPTSVLGMHFFSPANIMRLLEVVRGASTAPDIVVTAMTLAQKVGKVPVVTESTYGFIGNRMLQVRQDQALQLLLEGATPEQIDKVHTDFGMPMGPFQMIDLAGTDLGWHRDPSRVGNISEALCAAGRWGQKAGAGFYDYDSKRKPRASQVTQSIIAHFRAKAGIRRRRISDAEIVARTVYTMINEAMFILEEGVAQRSSDIDVVWVHGYGWPRWRGGPMYWAKAIGSEEICRALTKYADRLGSEFRLHQELRASHP